MCQWIKTSDQRPETPNDNENGYFESARILFTDGNNLYIGFIKKWPARYNWFTTETKPTYHWLTDDERFEFHDYLITHWMPLPKLPRELSALNSKINFEFEGKKYQADTEGLGDGMIGLPDGRVLEIRYIPETSQNDFKVIEQSFAFGGLVPIAEEVKED